MTDNCDCCTVPGSGVPAEVSNRPGLSAIAYRIGTFGSFRKSIVEALSRTPQLARLSSRAEDDYTITLIELWSAVADVLTFYHERIANEAYLRTATLRDSMLRLVRLLGYELAPGAAATTQIAFTIESGATAIIPPGTRVQSVPINDEKPQKFETLSQIEADARLNRLRLFPAPEAATEADTPLGPGRASEIFAPDREALAAGAALAPGGRVILYAPTAAEVLTVKELSAHDDMMEVRWELPVEMDIFKGASDAGNSTIGAYKLGRSFHLFGSDAPETMVIAGQTDPNDATSGYLKIVKAQFGIASGATQISLDGRYPGLKPGAVVIAVSQTNGATAVWPLLIKGVAEALVQLPTDASPVTALSGTVTQLTVPALNQAIADLRNVVIYELLGDPLRFWPYTYPDAITSGEVYVPGRRNGWSTIEAGRTIEKGAYKAGTVLDVGDLVQGRNVLLADGRGGEPVAATIEGAALVGDNVSFGPTDTDLTTVSELGLSADQVTPLTALVSAPLPATLTFRNPRRELIVTIGGLPAQTISLSATDVANGALAAVATSLENAIRAALPGAPTFALCRVDASEADADALTVVPGVPGDRVSFAASLSDADTVVDLGLDAGRTRFLDGVVTPTGVLTRQPADGKVSVTIGVGGPTPLPIADPLTDAHSLANHIETAFKVKTVVMDGDRIVVLPSLPKHEQRSFIRLSLTVEGPFALETASAVLLGNVAPASHGETIHEEIVGDGDASQAFQRFTLKKKPVTYVPAPVPSGVESSLQLSVNGVKWQKVLSLYGAKGNDQVYITQIADDGTLTVQFGDGATGARPASGRQNIVATYRQGIGLEGRVGAEKLSTLLDRPTGVKNATNPLPADGGADPETMERARETAPGTVRTFGRAVSLRDFEDKALLAGEVAKSMAAWVWTGERREVHLTVAAQGGATFSTDGLKRIAATLASERDPNRTLRIANYAPVPILIDASLIVKDNYINSRILEAARTTLLDAFSFEQRRFAEPVYVSDVYSILQNVEGVLAVDVNVLDLKNSDPQFRADHGLDPGPRGRQPRLLILPARPVNKYAPPLPAELAVIETPSQDVTLSARGGTSS